MKPEYYANIYRQYATFMGDWTNGEHLFRVASGSSGNDYNWTEVLMREIPSSLMEGIALHHYAVIDWNAKGSATAFDEKQYFTILRNALQMNELITKHSTIMDKYDPKKKIALVVDEWGGWYDVESGTNPGFLYQQNTIRDAMIAGVTLNIFNNHCERVRMANLAQTVNVLQAVILTKGAAIIKTPTFHVMEMYNVHQDATMLPLNLKTNEYVLGNEKLPAISASASKDKQGVTHISLVNIDPSKNQDIAIEMRGEKYTTVSGKILSSSKIQDYNSFDNPDLIKPTLFNGAKMANNKLTLQLPPNSVVVLTLK